MEPKKIINVIESAGAWFPLITMRRAFEQRDNLIPVFLDAVLQRAAGRAASDIRLQSVATFGLFFLAQHRDRRLLEPMVQLFESVDPWVQDEWLFSNRLGFFAHRLLAGVCVLDAQTPMDLALNPKLKSFMHLLQAGVALEVIALWLGHENPVTTRHYVEADLAMKRDALQRFESPHTKPNRFQPKADLLHFLDAL